MDSNQTPWQVGDKAVIIHSAYGGPTRVELVAVAKVSNTQLVLSNGKRATIRSGAVHGTNSEVLRGDDPYAVRMVAQAAMREKGIRVDNAAEGIQAGSDGRERSGSPHDHAGMVGRTGRRHAVTVRLEPARPPCSSPYTSQV